MSDEAVNRVIKRRKRTVPYRIKVWAAGTLAHKQKPLPKEGLLLSGWAIHIKPPIEGTPDKPIVAKRLSRVKPIASVKK